MKTAFLNATLQEEVYGGQIPGFLDADKSLVHRLNRAVYGLPQAGFEWYRTFKSILRSLGFEASQVDNGYFIGAWSAPPDPTIPMPADGSPLLMLLPVHVDDGLLATNSLPLFNWVITELQKHFELTWGPATCYLGIEIAYDQKTGVMRLSQSSFVHELLSTWNSARRPLHFHPARQSTWQ